MLRRHRKNLVYLLILFIPFLFFFVPSDTFLALKSKVVKLTSFPIRILSVPIKEIKKIIYYHRTFKEYKRLNEEVGLLKARLIGLEEVIRENKRLEDLLEFKRKLIYSSVTANVIGREPSHWNSSMIIDKGDSDGIKQGMPVVNAMGVVGKIAEVSLTESKAILLTDPQFSVAVLIQRPRESALVSGTLQGLCRLRFLDKDADIRVGDKVITSKLSSTFPEGLMIGEVIRVQKNPRSPTLECILRPTVSFSQLEEVLVILEQ